MTSRQPETVPPGTTGHAAILGDGGVRGDRETAGIRHRLVSARRWPVLVLPLTLLIIVGLAALRSEVTGPAWDGPLHDDPVAVGLALEIVLGFLLAFTIRRLITRARFGTARAAPAGAVAVKLRRVLVFVLGAGMIAVAVTMLVGLRQHLFSGRAGARPSRIASTAPSSQATRSGWHFFLAFHLHVTASLLYGLLALVLLGGVVLRIWWARRFRPSRSIRAYHYLGKDSQDLWEAVESGRSALHAIDDARAAIIACYLAMEASLAEHGAARAIADTPDELLTRAMATGIVRGTAAARLTALFYEARFSSHPLDRGQRDSAGRALGELATALAGAEATGTQARRSRAKQTGARA
jgi:hypothetical protein